MLYVLIGEDDFSIRQALEEIKKTIGDDTARLTNTTVLDGRQLTIEELRNACETVPFLAEKRLIIVEGLLGRFESVARTGRKRANNRSGEDDVRAFTDVMKQLPEFTELVLTDGKTGGNNPLLRQLTAITGVRSFPLLRQSQLQRWIIKSVASGGGSISPQGVNSLADFVGNDLWLMSNEIEKLIVYAAGRRIEESDVRALVSNAREAGVFAMVDAIIELRTSKAQESLQQLLRQGVAPAQLLVMISRQVRIIFQIKELRNQKKTRAEIQKKLGLTSDFVLKKAWEQSDRYSSARLREIYHRLLETDLSIKTGRYDGDLALDILIAELTRQGAVRS
ncbi:MAG TPA: DNA polymerase III subunit delta [Dehalococcoidia bacterium]|nr:DNA polymerase III subunit delta [Dehalococcoidia bacterium]